MKLISRISTALHLQPSKMSFNGISRCYFAKVKKIKAEIKFA